MSDSPFRAASFWHSLRYALNGIGYVVRSQRNFQIHLVITLLVVSAGFYFQIERFEWMVVTLLIGWVLGLECLNTGLEALVDLASGGDYHELAKIAKDVSASAVLIGATTSVVIGVMLFGPYLMAALGMG